MTCLPTFGLCYIRSVVSVFSILCLMVVFNILPRLLIPSIAVSIPLCDTLNIFIELFGNVNF